MSTRVTVLVDDLMSLLNFAMDFVPPDKRAIDMEHRMEGEVIRVLSGQPQSFEAAPPPQTEEEITRRKAICIACMKDTRAVEYLLDRHDSTSVPAGYYDTSAWDTSPYEFASFQDYLNAFDFDGDVTVRIKPTTNESKVFIYDLDPRENNADRPDDTSLVMVLGDNDELLAWSFTCD